TQSGDNPKWNQPLTNRIALDNIPYLQSFAFTDGDQHGVVIFNLSRDTALDVTVGGPNAPSGTVTMKRLGAANITDTNELAETVPATTQTLTNFDGSQVLSLPPYSMTVLSSGGALPLRRRAI